MQAWHQPFTVLKAQMTVKASKDSDYTRFLTELKDIMADQEAFMNELYVWISECASLDKAEVTIFSVKNTYKYIYIYSFETANNKNNHQTNEELFDAKLTQAAGWVQGVAAHLAGCQTSSGRFAGILGIAVPSK